MINENYLAGFFDGEGTCMVQYQKKKGTDKTYPHATVLLSQSGADGLRLLEEIQKDYGGRIYLHVSAGQHKAKKNAYKLYWNKDEATTMLQRILPYLKLKQLEAQDTLMYLTR